MIIVAVEDPGLDQSGLGVVCFFIINVISVG